MQAKACPRSSDPSWSFPEKDQIHHLPSRLIHQSQSSILHTHSEALSIGLFWTLALKMAFHPIVLSTLPGWGPRTNGYCWRFHILVLLYRFLKRNLFGRKLLQGRSAKAKETYCKEEKEENYLWYVEQAGHNTGSLTKCWWITETHAPSNIKVWASHIVRLLILE